MSIKRAPRPETRYVVLSKDVTENQCLSWEARGLLGYLLGKPDNWVVSIQNLINETKPAHRKKSGRDSIRAIIGELVDLGYMEVNQKRSDGVFDGVDYIVSETPKVTPIINGVPKTDFPSADEVPETDLPEADLPETGKPSPDNPQLISNDPLASNETAPSNDLNQSNELKNLPSVLSKPKRKKQDDNDDLGEPPKWLPIDAWVAFVEMRKAMGSRGKLTINAAQLIIKKLEELKNQGHDPRLVLEQSVINNWRGVFPIKQQFTGRQQALEDRNRQAVQDFASGGNW